MTLKNGGLAQQGQVRFPATISDGYEQLEAEIKQGVGDKYQGR